MAADLPLLLFPSARRIKLKSRPGFARDPLLHHPKFGEQKKRIGEQLKEVTEHVYKGSPSGSLAGMEPETVLVIEIVGMVEGFKQAINKVDGWEWLGEWGVEEIEEGAGFYKGITKRKRTGKPLKGMTFQSVEIQEKIEAGAGFHKEITKGERSGKPLKGMTFLSVGNKDGYKELLKLWEDWKKGEGSSKYLPHGKKKWGKVFTWVRNIRRWGAPEVLHETGMVEHWAKDVETWDSERVFQIELFYRQDEAKRKEAEEAVRKKLEDEGGKVIGKFLDMEEIRFHAVKAKLPGAKIKDLIKKLGGDDLETSIPLFNLSVVMYVRPTGQSMVSIDEEDGVEGEFSKILPDPELSSIVAILDGVPNLQHEALRDRLRFDDPDDLETEYQPGEKCHGTAIASLVVHGENPSGQSTPLVRPVYCLPVMQADTTNRGDEGFPDEIFYEERTEKAVRHMFESQGDEEPAAPDIKVINFSLGDLSRPFIRTPSPWARLLDHLSWKHRVLFCVSVGNFVGKIELDIKGDEFVKLPEGEKVKCTMSVITKQLTERRLISPAESLNALTVGAIHDDKSVDYPLNKRVDLLPNDSPPAITKQLFQGSLFSPAKSPNALPSPVSRFGHGFRRSIKPEVLFPGGRQLYVRPPKRSGRSFKVSKTISAPGQKVAWDSSKEGTLNETAYARGTSYATALATHGAAKIYEVLTGLRRANGEGIPNELMSVLIKTLLVHGAQQGDRVRSVLENLLKPSVGSYQLKEGIARFIGYGSVDIERVLACAEYRGTTLGFGEIQEKQVHEYDFPLPQGLSGSKAWRRMVVTLAWFSPINLGHRNLREAKLDFGPTQKWGETPLGLERTDSDHNQVKRGTVQHEVLVGESEVSQYKEDGNIKLQVTCKADACESLSESLSNSNGIPYGLAVTLEVAEGVQIPVYQQMRTRIHGKIRV